MNKIIIFLLIILTVIVNSCKTDFDVNAEWKDITLVYGLLNQSDSVQYIKVTKAFLGNESAYTMASRSDSLFYANAKVFVEEYQNGILKNTIEYSKSTDIPKLPGYFANDKNIIFMSKVPLHEESLYKLRVETGTKSIRAETELIQDFSFIKPAPILLDINLDKLEKALTVKWSHAPYGKIYELTLRLNYLEKNNTTGEISSHYIDWVQPQKIDPTLETEVSIDGFYQYVGSMLKPDANITRIIKKPALDFILLVGSADLNTYIEISRPSNGLTQDKPAYTNISNGIGIFSSRYKKVMNKNFLSETFTMFTISPYTKNLGFLDYEHSKPYWSLK